MDLAASLVFIALATVDGVLWRRWVRAPRGHRAHYLAAAAGLLGATLAFALALMAIARR